MSKVRKKSEIARDRRNIGRLYLKGDIQADIASALGLSQATVSRDLTVIQAQWKVERVNDFNEKKNIELAKVDNLELEYWVAWKRSQEDAEEQTVKKKGVIVTNEDGEEKRITPVEAQKRVKGQVGDARFLKGIEWCINKRCELLGLDAPKKLDHSGEINVIKGYAAVSPDDWDAQD